MIVAGYHPCLDCMHAALWPCFYAFWQSSMSLAYLLSRIASNCQWLLHPVLYDSSLPVVERNGHKVYSNVAKEDEKGRWTQTLHKTNFTWSARKKQTRKWHLTLTLVRLQPLNLTTLGEGMKTLLVKDHVHSSINGFRERTRAFTRPFELKYIEWTIGSFTKNHCSLCTLGI